MTKRALPPVFMTAAALAASLLLPASTASADTAPAPQDLEVGAHMAYDTGACTMDSASNDATNGGAFTLDGAPKTYSVTQAFNWHETATPANTMQSIVTQSATISVTAPGGLLSSFDFNSTAAITTTGAGNTTANFCSLAPQLSAATGNTFTLAKAGWLTITVSGSYGGPDVAAVVQAGTPTTYNINTYGSTNAQSTNTTRVFLQPGEVKINPALLLIPSGSLESLTQTGAVHITGTFEPLGLATAPQKGTTILVKLPDTLNCSALSYSFYTQPAIKGSKKLIFYWGTKRKTYTNLKGGKTVTLKSVPASGPVTIKAVLTKANGKTFTVTRSYTSCS